MLISGLSLVLAPALTSHSDRLWAGMSKPNKPFPLPVACGDDVYHSNRKQSRTHGESFKYINSVMWLTSSSMWLPAGISQMAGQHSDLKLLALAHLFCSFAYLPSDLFLLFPCSAQSHNGQFPSDAMPLALLLASLQLSSVCCGKRW